MVTISIETWIAAQPERCFDLARDVDVHLQTSASTRERVISGAGLLAMGDEVTWEAVHFGLKWRMTSRIIEYDPPRRFVDAMVRGPFAEFRHEHFYDDRDGGTLMRDEVHLRSPLGILGSIADAIAVGPHMRRFIADRAIALKRMAER